MFWRLDDLLNQMRLSHEIQVPAFSERMSERDRLNQALCIALPICLVEAGGTLLI